jgi:hypothetical protein
MYIHGRLKLWPTLYQYTNLLAVQNVKQISQEGILKRMFNNIKITRDDIQQLFSFTRLLTVTNYYYKPSTKHEKGHLSTFNIELGFKLTEFHIFWWIYVSAGVYQEKEARYQWCQDKKAYSTVELSWEGSRRHEKTTHRRGGPPGIGSVGTWGSTCQPPASTSVPPPS